MRKHWLYLKYVLRHKWFVFVAGLKTGAPLWRLVIHDWSKFTPSEWRPYVEYFYGPHSQGKGTMTPDIKEAFDAAWLHHQHRNAHHWQHWVLREDSGKTLTIPMPRPLVREMVADWMGAGRAITGKWEAAQWYLKNANVMLLHYETQLHAELLLGVKAKCGCGALGSTLAKCKLWGHCASSGMNIPPERVWSNG